MSAAERRRNAIFDQDSNPLSSRSTPKIKENIKVKKVLVLLRLEPQKFAQESSTLHLRHEDLEEVIKKNKWIIVSKSKIDLYDVDSNLNGVQTLKTKFLKIPSSKSKIFCFMTLRMPNICPPYHSNSHNLQVHI